MTEQEDTLISEDLADFRVLKYWGILRPTYCGRWFGRCYWVVFFILCGVVLSLDDEYFSSNLFPVAFGIAAALWCWFVRPVFYTFILTTEGAGRREHDVAENALLSLVKMVAVVGILAIVIVGIYWAVVVGLENVRQPYGVLALAIVFVIAGVWVLTRKPRRHGYSSTSWSKHDRIIIDRHQRLVIAGFKDPSRHQQGFEMVVRAKHIQPMVEELLLLLPSAEVVERSWQRKWRINWQALDLDELIHRLDAPRVRRKGP